MLVMEQEIFTTKFVLILAWIGFGKLLTISLFTFISNLPSKQKLRVYDFKASQEQTVRELKSSLLVITDPIVLALLVWLKLIKFAPDSSLNILLTIDSFLSRLFNYLIIKILN